MEVNFENLEKYITCPHCGKNVELKDFLDLKDRVKTTASKMAVDEVKNLNFKIDCVCSCNIVISVRVKVLDSNTAYADVVKVV